MFIFRQFEVFRLHALLHEAAGANRTHSGKELGWRNNTGRGPFLCLLGLVTALLFFFYVKLFHFSIFISVDFWICMSCIGLDIGFAYRNSIKEMGVFLLGLFRETHFAFQGSTNWKSEQVDVQQICTLCVEFCVEQRTFDSHWAFNNFPSDVLGEIFAKRTEKKQDSWQFKGWRGGKLGRSRLSQNSRSRWWWNVDLSKLPIQTLDYTSRRRALDRFGW